MAKVQKIKSKYHKYANFIFVMMLAVIVGLLYFYVTNKGYFTNTSEMKVDGSGSDMTKEVDKSFQPGDEKAKMPGKLKWGRDFY